MFAFSVLPSRSFAATIYLTTDASSIAVGDTVVVNVMMDPAGQKPNVVDGAITIQSGVQNMKITAFGVGGSVLTQWPNSPSLDSTNTISFVGGVPGGVPEGKGLLFRIAFTATKPGQVIFSPGAISVYNNDQNATLLPVSTMPLSVTIGTQKNQKTQDQWNDLVLSDHEPPHDLSVVFGQDPSVFNGMKFLTVSAVDDQSGIDHYEIQEGNFPVVRTGNTYVLQDQTGQSPITAFAYDRAGNVAKIQVVPNSSRNNYLSLLASVVVVLVVGVVGFWLYRAIAKHNKVNHEER
jgi:hypothetical protein